MFGGPFSIFFKMTGWGHDLFVSARVCHVDNAPLIEDGEEFSDDGSSWGCRVQLTYPSHKQSPSYTTEEAEDVGIDTALCAISSVSDPERTFGPQSNRAQ